VETSRNPDEVLRPLKRYEFSMQEGGVREVHHLRETSTSYVAWEVCYIIKVLSIVGARPNYVKLAAVYDVFSGSFEHMIVDTGQHYDYEMNRIFFDQLEIPSPHYFLDVGSGSHGYQVGETVKRVEGVLLREKPDLVIVYGDTNSALGGALAAAKTGFKVAHIEAGLRSFDMSMPEEINRRVIDHISYLLFAPTKNAYGNLLGERVPGRIFLTGDVHVRLLSKWIQVAENRSNILTKLGINLNNYMVVTVHRVENVDCIYRLSRLARLIRELAEYETVVFPVHPRTRKSIIEAGLDQLLAHSNIILTEPLGYMNFIKLLKHCHMVLTDSGGVQREAYLLRKPVVVLRRNTEWVELVETGWAKLLDLEQDVNAKLIVEWRPENYVKGLLGDEKAPERIVEIIKEF
jgi:UDP-N-acetylglucosamine 2-epimerase (non-hydrolysing)